MSRLALLASAATLGYLAWYAAACALFPFGPCRFCHATGRHPAAARRFRICRYCDGTGRRLRLGRRLYRYLRRLHRAGTR